jgi:hypothetical protein
MVLEAFATDAVLLAAWVGAIAEPGITRLLAFHSFRVVGGQRDVNPDPA